MLQLLVPSSRRAPRQEQLASIASLSFSCLPRNYGKPPPQSALAPACANAIGAGFNHESWVESPIQFSFGQFGLFARHFADRLACFSSFFGDRGCRIVTDDRRKRGADGESSLDHFRTSGRRLDAIHELRREIRARIG